MDSTAVCELHKAAPAVNTCRVCLRFTCEACTVLEDLRPYCPECLRGHRRSRSNRRWIMAAVGLVLAAGLGFGGWRFHRAQAEYVPPFDYGKLTTKVKQLEQQLAQEPCDRGKVIELSELMLQAGDNRGTLRRADAFFQKCGDFIRLRWLTYEAHKRVSEWDLAAAEATKLIESDPYDKDFRWWRGIVYEQKRDWEKAAEDYRQALALEPKLRSIPLNLATVYEQWGKPCEAIFPLEQLLHHYPEARGIDKVRSRIDQLVAKGGCGGALAVGVAKVRYDKRAGAIRTEAKLNEREKGAFVIDTGASYVTIGRPFAERLGLDLSRAPQVLLRTANGDKTDSLVTVDTIELGGVRANRVEAVVVDGLGDIDGLLGLSFLSRFDMLHTDGVLEISARTRG